MPKAERFESALPSSRSHSGPTLSWLTVIDRDHGVRFWYLRTSRSECLCRCPGSYRSVCHWISSSFETLHLNVPVEPGRFQLGRDFKSFFNRAFLLVSAGVANAGEVAIIRNSLLCGRLISREHQASLSGRQRNRRRCNVSQFRCNSHLPHCVLRRKVTVRSVRFAALARPLQFEMRRPAFPGLSEYET